jgi:tetratricopeptide (TPR) repeat protein
MTDCGESVVSMIRGKWLASRAKRHLRLAWYWQTVGDLDAAARAAERALRLAHRQEVPAKLVADAALTMARIAQDRDEFARCRDQLEHAVAVLRTAADDEERDRLLGWALVGVADQRRRAGDYPAAKEALTEALRLVESGRIPDPGLHTAVLTSQGITAKELGAIETAAQCYAQVSRIHRESGASRVDAAALEHNLAGLDYSRGRHAEAEAHARRALALRRQAPRVTEVEQAGDLAVLATALAAQQRYDEARDLLRETLRAYRAVRPPRRYEVAAQLHNLADLEHASGRLALAERLYREALSLKENLLGGDHPEVGLVANNLGTLLVERGREREAADCYRRALTIAERTYEPDHPVIGRVRHNLRRLRNPRLLDDNPRRFDAAQSATLS